MPEVIVDLEVTSLKALVLTMERVPGARSVRFSSLSQQLSFKLEADRETDYRAIDHR
jgi:hypothetical protein